MSVREDAWDSRCITGSGSFGMKAGMMFSKRVPRHSVQLVRRALKACAWEYSSAAEEKTSFLRAAGPSRTASGYSQSIRLGRYRFGVGTAPRNASPGKNEPMRKGLRTLNRLNGKWRTKKPEGIDEELSINDWLPRFSSLLHHVDLHRFAFEFAGLAALRI